MNMTPFLCRVSFAFVIVGVWLGWATAGQAGPARTTVLIPFEPLPNHGVPMVKVRLNDKVTGTFLIDTGASDCLLTDRMAGLLGLKIKPGPLAGRLATVGFKRFDLEPDVINNNPHLPSGMAGNDRDAAVVKKFQLGRLAVTDVNFSIINADELQGLSETPIDGIIGGSMLSQFALFIDAPRHLIALISPGGLDAQTVAGMKLSDAAALPMETTMVSIRKVSSGHAGPVWADTRNDIPAVTSSALQSYDIQQNIYSIQASCANGDHRASETLSVDTGAFGTSLSQSAAERLKLVPLDRQATSTVRFDSIFDDLGHLSEMHLGNLTLTDLNVEYPATKEAAIPSLLGQDVLSYCIVLFDYPKKKLYLKPILPPFCDLSHQAPLDPASVDLDRLRRATEPCPSVSPALALASNSDSAASKALSQVSPILTVGQRRDALKTNPSDSRLLADLAEALIDAGQFEDAEKTARQAVLHGPRTAHAWIVLGDVLHTLSLRLLTKRSTTVDLSDGMGEYQSLIAALRADPPSDAAVAEAKRLSAEAHAAFDTGVSVAPNDPEVYRARAQFLADDGLGIQATVRELQGNPVDLMAEIQPSGYFQDEDSLARLCPHDITVQHDTAEEVITAAVVNHGHTFDLREGKFWQTLLQDTGIGAQDKLQRLLTLSQDPDSTVSAPALEALGDLQYRIVQDLPLAEVTLRTALAKDPTRAGALDTLARLLSSQQRTEDLIDLLSGLTAKHDNAQIRMLLARAYEKQGEWEHAEPQIRKALAFKPESFSVNLALATLLLHRSEPHSDALKEAQGCLEKARIALGPQPSRARRVGYKIALAIYLGLAGDPETAEKRVLEVLNDTRTSTQARDVLAALVL